MLGKLRKLLGSELDRGFERSLEIGAGTGYFSLNLLQAGVVREATCTDISPGMVGTLGANAARLGLEVRAARADAESLPFADESFDLRARTRGAPPPARPATARSRSFTACCAPAAGSCSPASRRGRATASPAAQARRLALAPLWRAALRARPAPGRRTASTAPRTSDHDSSGSSTSTRSRRGPRSVRAPRRVRRHPGPRRGARRELFRVVQPRARGERRSRRRADAVAAVRVSRLPALQRLDEQRARAAAAAGDLLQPAAGRAQGVASVRCRTGSRTTFRCSRSGSSRCPGELVPLHIFEERYKTMMNECLRDENEFGIVWLSDDGLREIGCACAIERVLERMEDGRMNLLTRGTRAFRVLERQSASRLPGRGRRVPRGPRRGARPGARRAGARGVRRARPAGPPTASPRRPSSTRWAPTRWPRPSTSGSTPSRACSTCAPRTRACDWSRGCSAPPRSASTSSTGPRSGPARTARSGSAA